MAIAIVRFWGKEKGGRQNPPLSGYRPHVYLQGMYTSCFIEGFDGKEAPFAFEQEHRVKLRLMFPDYFPGALKVGDEVNFYEGARQIGSGVVIEE